MPTVNQLTTEQLANAQVFDKVKSLVEEITRFCEEDRAFEMSQQMKLALTKLAETNKDGESYKNYQRLYTLLLWTAFIRLPEENILELLRTSLLSALEQEVDVSSKITAKLFFLPYSGRDQLRREMLRAVEANFEKLGDKKINEWLVLYNQFEDFMGRDEMSLINFFNQSQSARTLTPENRKLLENIFKIYDSVLTSTPDIDEETATELFQTETRQPLFTLTPAVAPVPEQNSRLTAPPRAPQSPKSNDKYLQPIDPQDLKNKFKMEMPQKKPASLDEGVVNPANVVDLRDRQES